MEGLLDIEFVFSINFLRGKKMSWFKLLKEKVLIMNIIIS